MRVLTVALLLSAAMLTPSAAAGAFDLGVHKVIEHGLQPGANVTFEMPLAVRQDGHLYAKVLPTAGNAVNDGRANGTVEPPTGWRVTFAIRTADGNVTLGTRVDSTETPLVRVRAGDTPTLVMTVSVPDDAAKGGPRQHVYVAVAYRLDDTAAQSGGPSGAIADEARALTLLLTDALLPPAVANEPAAPGAEDVDQVGPLDPVGPITPPASRGSTVVMSPPPLPTWFLIALLVVLAALVVAVVFAVRELHALRLVVQAERAHAPRVAALRETAHPTRIDVRVVDEPRAK